MFEVTAMFQPIRTRLARATNRLIECRLVRRLLRQQDGAAAVEFAFVAGPFLLLLFAILQTAIVFFAGQALETAVADSARLIMTGQAQTAGLTQSTFKDEVCKHIYGLFDCGKMYVDVRTFNSFSYTLPNPVDENGNVNNNMLYQPGNAGDIVVVRLMYPLSVYVSLLGLGNMADNQRLLVATAVFRNEPYQ
jgi:Flp pilus assembly protein TadG